MQDKPKVGIIGVGMVGGPIARYFEEFKGYKRGQDLLLYDVLPEKCAGNINDANIIFVCVPTPRSPKDNSCDVSIIERVLPTIKGEKVVVIKSTVPPGTTERFQKQYPHHKFLFNPEFLTESRAWEDMIKPDRQIVGFTNASLDAAYLVLSLLPKAPFMSPWGIGTYQQTRITATDAEIIKYAGNIHFARKVNWANALSRVAEKLGANYENIRKGMAADHRIGDSHLDVHHGGYKGFGGYCLAPEERLFIFNDDHYKVIEAKNLDNKAKSVLGWKDGRIIVDRILAVGRRTVDGLVRFMLTKGRSLTVTPDHIVTVADQKGRLREKIASEVDENDLFPVVLDGFRSNEQVSVKLYEEVDLRDYQVFIEKVPQDLVLQLEPYLTSNQLRGFRRRRHQSIPLTVCLKAGINIDSYRMKTAKSGTWIPTVIKIDKNFSRLLGYYLAEGCVTDGRVSFTFGFQEKDLVDDLESILHDLKIKYSKRVNYWDGHPSVLAVKVSSRILAGYFERFGKSSSEKTIPYFIFHANQDIKDNLLAGLFRGDGSIFKANTGNYWTVNYATVSRLLAEGVDALLREKGILASIKQIKTKKTKLPAWSLNVSEFKGVKILFPFFSERQRSKVGSLGGRNIKSPAYTRFQNLALLPIRVVEKLRKVTEVVSVETVNHRYISSWGILTHNCFPKDTAALMSFAKSSGLNDVHALLAADWKFNEDLLAEQGLTVEDVSKHITEMEVLEKKNRTKKE